MVAILESEGHGRVADLLLLLEQCCSGCDLAFVEIDLYEGVYDRVFRRSYVIHPDCWELLLNRVKRSNYGRDLPWQR